MNGILSYFKTQSATPAASSSIASGTPNVTEFGISDLTQSYYRRGYLGWNTSLMKSGLQKQIRRGNWIQAHRWSMLLLAGYAIENLWNRLLTICSEDISIGNEAVLETVYRNHCEYLRIRKETERRPDIRIDNKNIKAWRRDLRNDPRIRYGILETIWVMCQAKKTRICDHINGSIMKQVRAREASIVDRETRSQMYDTIQSSLEACWNTRSIESEMRLIEQIGLYITSGIPSHKYKDMLSLFIGFVEFAQRIGDTKRAEWTRYLQHCFEQRNKGSSRIIKGNTNLMNAVLLFSREEIGYEPISIPEKMLQETVQSEFHTLIQTPDEFILDDASFLHDKHVIGSSRGRTKEEMTLEFYQRESEGLTPAFTLVDPYYGMALKEFGGLEESSDKD